MLFACQNKNNFKVFFYILCISIHALFFFSFFSKYTETVMQYLYIFHQFLMLKICCHISATSFIWPWDGSLREGSAFSLYFSLGTSYVCYIMGECEVQLAE